MLKRIFSAFGSLGKRKTAILLGGVVLTALGATAIYLKVGYYGADTTQTGEVINEATLTYTDSQGNPNQTVTSNQTYVKVSNSQSANLNFDRRAWYLFSLPLQPSNPDPLALLGGSVDNLDNKVQRWDEDVQSCVIYDSWYDGDPSNGDEHFGNLETGYGYWFDRTTLNPSMFTVNGVEETSKSILLHVPDRTAHSHWALLGNPFTTPIRTDGPNPNITFIKDGLELNWEQAADPPYSWLNTYVMAWNSDLGVGYPINIGPEKFWNAETIIQPYHGFWINAWTNDLTVKFTK